MSERMTSIRLPGSSPRDWGFAEWGQFPIEVMIARHRLRAQFDLERAQAILAATDEDFRVETFRGINVRTNLKVLQEGRSDS